MTGEGGPRPGRPAGRPSGRPAGGSTAREDILAAARDLFSRQGFDRTTMRQVAQRAEVDAALISHYFGSKQGLFVAAVEIPADPGEVLRPLRLCPQDELGATALRAILGLWESAAGPAVVARLRHAIAVDESDTLRDLLSGVILPILHECIRGADEVELRLGLFASQVAGVLLTRQVIGLPSIAGADVERLVTAVGPTLQRYLTGEIG